MITIDDIVNGWNTFFFSPVPVHSVALFRILISSILLLEALFLLMNVKKYLGPDGVLSYDQYFKRNRKISFSLFLYMPPTMNSVNIIMGLHMLFLVFMLLGLFTPISVIVVFITLISITNRNIDICNGGDIVARSMVFLLIFADSGKTFSLDEYLFMGQHESGRGELLQEPWALRLMQLQLSMIYLKSLYWKIRGKTYRNGTALYYILQNETYSRLKVPKFLLKKKVVQIMTWGVLALQLFLAAGLWINELYYPAILAGIAFHLSIELTMNVHLFGWYMIASLLLFVDPNDIMRLHEIYF